MSRRDFPYFPLYVQDFQGDENLMECSAEATGVYIRLILLMHKSKHYGKVLLEQKYQQVLEQNLNFCSTFVDPFVDPFVQVFAQKLSKFFPWEADIIQKGLMELIENKVIYIDGYALCQKRMIKDADISHKRALAGKSSAKKRGFFEEEDSSFVRTKVPAIVPTNVQTKMATKVEQNIEISTSTTFIEEEEVGNEGGIGNERGVQGGAKPGGEKDLPKNEKAKKTNISANMNKLYEVTEFLNVYFRSQKYASTREMLAIRSHLTLESLEEFAKVFNKYLIISANSLSEDGQTMKIESDWARHFSAWLNKIDTSKSPQEIDNQFSSVGFGGKPNGKIQKSKAMPRHDAPVSEWERFYENAEK